MPERRFIILKCVHNVPLMASCACCERKFFTPTNLRGKRAEAEQYLLEKFDQHLCKEDQLVEQALERSIEAKKRRD